MNAEEAAQRRREECRSEVRRYLAERPALAFPYDAIRRKLGLDGNNFSDEEVQTAAEFLVDLGEAKILQTRLGATKNYKATSEGVVAHERSL